VFISQFSIKRKLPLCIDRFWPSLTKGSESLEIKSRLDGFDSDSNREKTPALFAHPKD
jgi:hypothetical protein